MFLLSLWMLAELTVTLPPQARVAGAEIRLGEIAAVRGAAGPELERLRALELGYAPSPGYSRLLPRWRIERLAADALPGVRIDFAGEEAVRVLAAVRELAAGELESAAREALTARMGGVAAVLELAEPLSAILVPAGSEGVTLDAQVPATEPRPGRWSVPVRVRVDGLPYSTVWTAWQVELTRTLPVLVRDLPIGAAVGPDAVRLEHVRVDAPLAGTPLDVGSLLGTVAARPLSAGSVLLDRDVRRELLVRQNGLVQLEVKNGLIVARVSAVARQSGHHGATVRVQVSNTGRELSGRVIGEDLVQVSLGGGR